jgi:hypothetical protein
VVEGPEFANAAKLGPVLPPWRDRLRLSAGPNRNLAHHSTLWQKRAHVFEAFPPEIEPLRALPYRAWVNDDCRMRVG